MWRLPCMSNSLGLVDEKCRIAWTYANEAWVSKDNDNLSSLSPLYLTPQTVFVTLSHTGVIFFSRYTDRWTSIVIFCLDQAALHVCYYIIMYMNCIIIAICIAIYFLPTSPFDQILAKWVLKNRRRSTYLVAGLWVVSPQVLWLYLNSWKVIAQKH